MGYEFNVAEIFEMAEQIERNGAQLYKDAALFVRESSHKDFLLELSAMEVEHEKTFSDMKKKLSKEETTSTVFDPEGETSLYLKALADTRVFFKKNIELTSIESVLKAAIIAEKDSIVFYLGMKEFVADSQGKDKIEYIINEEMKHIRLLSNRLSKLKE